MYPQINKINITREIVGVIKPATIQFDDGINPIVITGNNGSGKTVLLNSIETAWEHEDPDVILEFEGVGPDNHPIMVDCADIVELKESSGEAVFTELYDLLSTCSECIIIDSPESFLSISSQVAMTEIIQTLSLNNLVIVSSNSIPLLAATEDVYDMSSMEWVRGEDYVKAGMTCNLKLGLSGEVERVSLLDVSSDDS